MTNVDSTAAKIKFLRTQKHYTQKVLANLVGVKPTTVSSWELGASKPTMKRAKKLAEVLGTDLNYLMDMEEKKEKNNKTEFIDLKEEPKVIAYGGKPISKEDMEIIKAILERHLNGGD